uniref:Lipopolysaccharide-induced tumor necrosis factor-alpha factor homolog n=1 Tax=Fundulus heteroclitus TaxID=8078 RepID=A0A3Q2P6T9_FUNHE
MGKGDAPPPISSDIPAPPYPGPPLVHNVVLNKPEPQPVAQQYQQPVAQQYLQPVAQQYQQPVAQQYLQPVAQQPTDAPGRIQCRYCQTTVVTSTESKVGLCTWLTFGGLFIFGIWPVCLIPFCVPPCKDVQHSCPTCNNVLYIYKRC